MRAGIREMIAGDPQLSVAGEIALPSDVTATCVHLSPDILILGLGDSGDGRYALSALAALRRMARAAPGVRTIVLVSGDAIEDVLGPLRAGAKAVMLRVLPHHALVGAVHDVLAGRDVLDPRLTGPVFGYLTSASGLHSGLLTNIDPAVRMALSPREQEVLRSLAQGRRNEEIAAQLGVSVGTVKTHLRHIYRKLEVDDRISAVLTAFQLRLPDAA